MDNPGFMEPQQILFLAIVAGALVLLVTEWIRLDLTAVLIILALAGTGLLEPAEALSGFASEPAILLASVFVLSGGLSQTGLTERIGAWIGHLSGNSLPRAVLVIMPAVALMAAFTHHLMITAMMLPVILGLSRSRDLRASRLLMPMAFAASLGTTVTVFAAPAFLVARDILERRGHEVGIFEVAPIGFVMIVLGTLFVLALGRWLLPRRAGAQAERDRFRLERYYTELLVLEGSKYAGWTMKEFRDKHEDRFQVVDWLRHGHSRSRPWRRKKLAANDLLLVRASPEELAPLGDEKHLALHAVVQYGEEIPDEPVPGHQGDERLVQALVGPDSELVGKTVGSVDFLTHYGVVVVGLWRKRGFMRTELARVQLKAGDLLVLWGTNHAIDRIVDHPSFLFLVPFEPRPRKPQRAWLAGGIMLASVTAAATGLLPVTVAFLGGAAAMVAGRCLSLTQAYESIEVKIFVFIAGAIPLGIAMEQTGTAALFAGWLSDLAADLPVIAILFAVFAASALFTQLLSDAATTVLLGPIALGMAAALPVSAPALVFSVALGAVVAFLTPIGHHGNLLVYEPGNYRFTDFLRVGGPLTLLLGLATAWLAPVVWPVG